MIVTRRMFLSLGQLTGKQTRALSHAALEKLRPISNEGLVWKTNENDPRKHTDAHECLYYLLPDNEQLIGIYARSFGKQPAPFQFDITRFYSTIGMFPIMIRRPFLDATNYVKNLQPDMPNLRILFYGDIGHGKSHTLVHMIHYLHASQEHFIVKIDSIKKFTRSPHSLDFSSSRPGRLDTNADATTFLKHFRITNSNLLEKHKGELKCSQDYKWSLREITETGEPLINVIDHGISRVIHASDCVAVLLKELSLAADKGQIKLATFIDNVQHLFYREAGVLKHPDHKRILVNEITVARALKKLIKQTNKNSIVFASCHDEYNPKQNIKPQEAIGQEGWDHFDPFLPLHVPKYSRKEFESCMNFYQDIGWLTRPESRTREVRDEIRFMSGLNPGEVHYLCQAL